MPRYARYYSATEAEAATTLSGLGSRRLDAPAFTKDDAEHLEGLLKGTVMTPSRPRNDTNRPLFRLMPAVEDLLSGISSFSIVSETVYRDNFVHHDSMSEESTGEWKTRSRTPSSDEPSPQRVRIAAPTLSVRATASSDGSDDDMPHPPKRTELNQLHSWGPFPDHYATYPDNVLQNMDTQFSKWSYNLNEGTTSVPFVMAKAPPDTHESLVKVDGKFWATGDEDVDRNTVNSDGSARSVLERAQKKSPKLPNKSKPIGAPKLKILTAANAAPTEESASKRAALITKSIAAKDSALLVSESANQRRSAMQRNRNRRSIMPSPPPTARRAESGKKQVVQTEESRPNILVVDRKDEDQCRDLDPALGNGKLDLSNDRHMAWLMKRLKSIGADNEENGSRMIGEVEETEPTGRTQRRKGKARKNAKSGAAR
ncbi:hypothetical protein N0V91_007229 [Didymella pomorum]|uniref:Uncharacterized protein n=1 Tax=Didymella pomorum TaxID=749634 RepID=A0A9W8Z9D7_9PLEO|nr:hypothetical protein N0V91_007229 [Didymella pomorum]